MLDDLVINAGEVGLQLHMGKANILSSRGKRLGCLAQRCVEIHGENVDLFPAVKGTLYFGKNIHFQNFHDE